MEPPLEKKKGTRSSILAWRIPRTTALGVAESDTTERLSLTHSNPHRLLSTSLPLNYSSLTSSTTSFEAPSLLFKNQCLRSSFTKNIPSCSSVPQLLAEAAEFLEITRAHEVQRFCGSGAHRCTHILILRATQGAHNHTGWGKETGAHHRAKLALLWSYSFWRMVRSPSAIERINLLDVC